MESESMKGYLFNCDKTCKLDQVEAFLFEMEEKHNMKIDVDKLYFELRSMSEISETKIPRLKMDFAVFVLHANESRLSINEENAGIGYAKFYKALVKATGDKVLIVIAGDTSYKDETEKEQSVISRWARRKVASQFDEEHLDGRKSFIFSWNLKHQTIHEEALLHFFDPNKKGEKFRYQPKLSPELQVTPSVAATPREGDKVLKDGTSDLLVANDELDLENENSDRNERSKDYRDTDTTPALMNYPKGTVLLKTRLRYGKVSFKESDVVERQQEWQPSDMIVQDLKEKQNLVPDAVVQFTADGDSGINCNIEMNHWQSLKYYTWSIFYCMKTCICAVGMFVYWLLSSCYRSIRAKF